MAKSKVEEVTKVDEPTRDDIKAAVRWVATYTNRVPTLWGPTASGKTHMGWQISQEDDAEYIVVLLSQYTPEEIAGFQFQHPRTGEMTYSLPYWFQTAKKAEDAGRKVVIMFDELGLARQEVMGAMLTFFRDRHLHGHYLGKNVMVLAAMNPHILEPAYRTRCCLFHVPADRDYLRSFASSEWAKMAVDNGVLTSDTNVAFSNEPPETPVAVDGSGVAALSAINREYYQLSEPAQLLILRSLVPPATASTIWESYRKPTINVTTLLRDHQKIEEVLPTMDDAAAITLACSLLDSLHTVSKEEAADAVLSIVMGMWTASPERYTQYIETPKSTQADKNLLSLDAAYMSKRVEERDIATNNPDKEEVGGRMIDIFRKVLKDRGEEDDE